MLKAAIRSSQLELELEGDDDDDEAGGIELKWLMNISVDNSA